MPNHQKQSFVFWNNARFFIMVVSLFCLSLAQLNSMTFNFTVICMNDVITEHHSSENFTEVHWLESSLHESLLFAGPAIGSLLGTFPAVPLISSFGIRRVLTASGFISAISSALFPLAVSFNFHSAFLCRILQGLGASVLFPAVGLIPVTWAPQNEMGTFLAVLSSSFQVSSILSTSVPGMLCESQFGWRSVYYLFGGLTFLGFVLFYAVYQDDPIDHRNVSARELSTIRDGKVETVREAVPYKAISTDVTVLVCWLSVFGGDIGFMILVLYGPTYLSDVLHFNVRATGFATALPFLLSAGVKFSAGQLSDRLNFVSEKIRLTFCAILSQFGVAALFIVMAMTSNRLVAQIAYTLAIAGAGLNIMGTIKCVQLRCREHVHFAISVMSFLGCLIGLLAPFGVGLMVDERSFSEQWSRLFVLVSILITILNLPFPFLISVKPGPYVKVKPATGNKV